MFTFFIVSFIIKQKKGNLFMLKKTILILYESIKTYLAIIGIDFLFNKKSILLSFDDIKSVLFSVLIIIFAILINIRKIKEK